MRHSIKNQESRIEWNGHEMVSGLTEVLKEEHRQGSVAIPGKATDDTDKARSISIMPYDIAYVPKLSIRNANTLADEYVHKMPPLPYTLPPIEARPLSFTGGSVSYNEVPMAAQTQPQQQSPNMQDFLTIFFKHKWKILITFVLVAGATCVTALQTTPKQFVAKGVVMVRFGREFVQVSEVGDQGPSSLNPESIINTEVQILTGRDLLEKVVDAVGAEELYPELGEKPLPPDWRREIAILNFRGNLGVNPVKGSNLIEVYFRNKNPQITAKAVNTLVDKLQERHLQVFSDPKSSFLEAQTKDYQEKLSKSEADIETFKQRNQVFVLDEQRSLLLKERDETEAMLKTEQVRSRELQEKISFLKDRKNVYTDGVLEQLRSNLNGLEQKEQELASKYNDDNLTLVNHRK